MSDKENQIEFLFVGDNSSLKKVARESDSIVEGSANKVGSTESLIRSEYGISSSVIQRRTAQLTDSAASAVQASSSIVTAEKALQAEFGITADIIRRREASVTSNIPLAVKPVSMVPSAKQGDRTPQRDFGVTQDFQAEMRMEEQLAADRIKWAGQRAAAAELDTLATKTWTGARKEADKAEQYLLNTEKKVQQALNETKNATDNTAAAMLGLSNSSGIVSSVLSALISPIGLITAGLLATVAAGALAAGALFGMASAAGTYGDRLDDTSAKTGISISNLLALDVAGQQVGASLERITTSVTRLEKRLGNADDATDRVSKGLKKWGIDTSNVNKALEQIIEKLGQFPEGVRRTQVAMDVFGIAGKDFAAITTAMKGNLPGFRHELEELGIVLGETDVKAAAAFEDQQILLSKQWEILQFKIQSAATPIVKEWLKDISDWMAKNQQQIIEWGKWFVQKLADIVVGVKDLYDWLWKIKDFSPIWIEINVVRKIIDSAYTAGEGTGYPSRSGNLFGAESQLPHIPRQSNYDDSGEYVSSGAGVPGSSAFPENPFGRDGKKKGGGSSKSDPAKHELEMERERVKQTLEGFTREQTQWDDMNRQKLVSMEVYTSMALSLETSRSKTTLEGLQKEYETASKLKKPDEREQKQLEITGKIAQERNRLEKAGSDRTYALEQEQLARFKATQDGKSAISEVVAQQEKDRVSDLAQHRILTEEAASKQIMSIELSLLENRAIMIRGDLAKEKSGSSQYIALQYQLGQNEAQRAAVTEQSLRKISDARDRDLENARQFVSEMIHMNFEVMQSSIGTARAGLESKIRTGGMNDPNDQRDARAALDRVEENARFEQQIYDLHEKARVALKDKTYAEIQIINGQYIKTAEQMEIEHNARLKDIDDRRLEELHAGLDRLADTSASLLSDSIAAGFEDGISAGVASFERGILQMIQSVLLRNLQQQLLSIFDDLAGRGGIIGKIFEVLTGVHKGKTAGGVQTQTIGGVTDAAKESAAMMTKVTSDLAVTTTAQTKELNMAVEAQTREIASTIQSSIEHLCQCNQPAQQGFWSTILQAAIGGAITGLTGGGGNQADEGPDTGPVKTPPKLKPKSGKYEGGNFGSYESFPVGEHGPETVYTGERGGFVVPQSTQPSTQGRDRSVNITFNVPVLGGSSYSQPKSRREYLQTLAPLIEELIHGS